MDLPRAIYSRDLKITAMRSIDGTTSEVARKFQLSPKLLEHWREDWRAKGETAAFPGIGRRGSTVVPGLVHHSDRGMQYASLDYTEILKEHYVKISMS